MLRGDTAGAPLALSDRRGSAELEAAQWIGGSFEASLEREHRVALRAWVQRAQAGDPSSEPLEVLAHGVAARARWFELWLRLAGDTASGARAIDGIGRDITERREAELERAMVSAIEGEWFRNASLEVALMRVLRSLAQALFCEYVELWWLDDRYDVLHAGECWHAGGAELDAFARGFRNRSFGKGVGLAGRVWADAAPVRLDDLANEVDPRCARLADVGPFASALGLPIQIGDRILGVAVLLSALAADGARGAGAARSDRRAARPARRPQAQRARGVGQRGAQERDARVGARLRDHDRRGRPDRRVQSRRREDVRAHARRGARQADGGAARARRLPRAAPRGVPALPRTGRRAALGSAARARGSARRRHAGSPSSSR